MSGLLLDAHGALYGTTEVGGNVAGCYCGIAYKLSPTPSGYSETVIHDFAGAPNDGGIPMAPLITDSSGNLYGTTKLGGNGAGVRCGKIQTAGCGTVFRLSPNGSGYTEAILFNFFDEGLSGRSPLGGLVMDQRGVLYGTTELGGTCEHITCGTIFALRPTQSGAYQLETLHIFRGPDGFEPSSSMIIGAGNVLFGTTPLGGNVQDYGTVYALPL